MSFEIKSTSNGKPLIIFNGHKFRESYSRKSGETIWRCLGKSCNASVTTNSDKTEVISSKTQHTGHHPVTMRSPASPLPPPRSSPTAPIAAETRVSATSSAASTNTPVAHTPKSAVSEYTVNTPCNASSKTPATNNLDSNNIIPETTEPSSFFFVSSLPVSPDPPTFACLKEENEFLRLKVAEQRYTIQAVTSKVIELEMLRSETDQSKNEENASSANAPLSKSDNNPKDNETPVSTAPHSGSGLELTEARDLIENLKTTIQVLEAEIDCLKNEKNNCSCHCNEWTTVSHKGSVKQKTDNNFKPLQKKSQDFKSKESETDIENNSSLKKKKGHRKPNKNEKSTAYNQQSYQTNNVQVPFPKVEIYGDSHARHIAGLTRDIVNNDCLFTGICKPSAGLLSVVPTSKDVKADCLVLIAGSNDVATGKQSVIYRHLDGILRSHERRKIVLSTLPYRYDLPSHHTINDEIAFANSFIKETAARHPNVVLMDINRFPRKHFTRHGQHFSARGKRGVTRLMVSCVQLFKTTISSPAVLKDGTTESVPITLPFDSYAEAVKNPLPTHVPGPSSDVHPNSTEASSLINSQSSNCHLLENYWDTVENIPEDKELANRQSGLSPENNIFLGTVED